MDSRLDALRGRLRLLQNEHRSTIELLETSKESQQEEIRRTKEDNQRLRARLLQLQKKSNLLRDARGSGGGGGGSEGGGVGGQQQVDQARREGDELKVQASQLRKELEELKDKVRTLDLELAGAAATAHVEATPSGGSGSSRLGPPQSPQQPPQQQQQQDARVRDLEERLDKVQQQHGEAQEIRATYEQIVKRLKEERISFDHQISALERTVALKQQDLRELTLLSGDAAHARTEAQQALATRKVAYEGDRRRREEQLREKQQVIQLHLRSRRQQGGRPSAAAQGKPRRRVDWQDQGHRRHRDEEAKAAAGNGDSEEEEDEDDLARTEKLRLGLEEQERETARLGERKRALEGLRQVARRVKGLMDVATVEEVVAKLAKQAEAVGSLGLASRENQARVERLQAERDALHAMVDAGKYAPDPRQTREKVAAQLARGQEAVGKLQLRYQQLLKLLKGVRCSVEHLAHQLKEAGGGKPPEPAAVTAAASPRPEATSPRGHQAVDTTALVATLSEVERALGRMVAQKQQWERKAGLVKAA